MASRYPNRIFASVTFKLLSPTEGIYVSMLQCPPKQTPHQYYTVPPCVGHRVRWVGQHDKHPGLSLWSCPWTPAMPREQALAGMLEAGATWCRAVSSLRLFKTTCPGQPAAEQRPGRSSAPTSRAGFKSTGHHTSPVE